MRNFWHSVENMKLYNRDKNKGKLQSFVNFTKKKIMMIFWASHFIKRPHKIFLLTIIMFKHVKCGKHIVQMGSKIK